LQKKALKFFLKNKKMKKTLAGFVSFALLILQSIGCGAGAGVGAIFTAYAGGGAGSVVINEIAWAGSIDNSNDEWIELYNTTSQAIDLAGWYVEDDYVDKYVIASGVVPAKGYFLIEDSESAVLNISADAVIGLSLANSGDSLILKNAAGAVIDSVNAGGGAWYFGDNVTKATMERISPSVLVDSAANFASAVSGNGSAGSSGSAILGTPKGQNSVFSGGQGTSSVEFDLSSETPLSGSTVTATVIANNVVDLFAYGFDVIYNPAVLEYVNSSEAGFLSGNGQVTTSFNADLEDGLAGKLVVGNARLISPASGVAGSGNLFTITFKVIGGEGAKSDLTFGGGSFVADISGDVLVSLKPASLTVSSNQIEGVSNAAVAPGVNIYSLKLTWSAPAAGADSYIIFRKKTDGTFAQIGTSTGAEFTDNDSLNFGGKIVPGITYTYQIKAVKNGIQSSAVEKTGVETRGLKGDNNRSGRVDGRDIENLAKHYGSKTVDAGFNPLLDTTFDGIVDGSDLIDIGANFALTFK
jgi:hypothetical protein